MLLFPQIPFLLITVFFIIGLLLGAYGFLCIFLLFIPIFRKYWLYLLILLSGVSIKLISNYPALLPEEQKLKSVVVIDDELSTYKIGRVISVSPSVEFLLDYNNVNKGDTLFGSFYFESIDKYKVDNKSLFHNQSLEGIDYIGYIYTDSAILVKPNNNSSFANKIREYISVKLSSMSLPSENIAVLKALIIGDNSEISPATKRIYKRSGVMHALAVSGMHVGILFLLLNLVLSFLNYSYISRIVKMLLIISILVFYAILCNLSPSVVRAVVMFSLFQITSQVITGRYHAYNILFLSAFILLVFNPNLIWNISFQLTYIAMLSVIYFVGQLKSEGKTKRQKIYSLISISFFVSITVLPISLYYFGEGSFFSVVPNILMIFLLPIIFTLTIINLIIPIDFTERLIGIVFDIINLTLETFSSIDIFFISNVKINSIETIAIYVAITLVIIGLKERKRLIRETQSSAN